MCNYLSLEVFNIQNIIVNFTIVKIFPELCLTQIVSTWVRKYDKTDTFYL